jgi:cation diffusion facilitator CzcD-associated flavoprotein CzcO
MADTHFDVIIVGAGLSGVGAARHLQINCPGKTFALLEGRESLGGTWDLFRYPGIRSDSDMYTLGYSFRPWTEAKAIADGPSILKYVKDTAAENNIEQHVRLGHQVKRASWSTADAQWTVECEMGPDKQRVQLTCGFLFMCSGYYDYEAGYTPDFAGIDSFAGTLIHPQKWPKDLDYSGKTVVIIGSGATAVTLVPEMAKTAAHVTMLQRSPTYIVARPDQDAVANWLRARLPAKLAYSLTRWKTVLLGMYFFRMCRTAPDRVKALLLGGVRQALGPDYDVAKHFTPSYNPWDQRLCLVPNGDLFEAIKGGQASVVTDQIETFTPTGLKLKSGQTLEADIVVTATGLNLQLLGGLQVSVDGVDMDVSQTLSYRGMMYSDLPNMASSFGYTNASWTLKCDLTCEYVCRLLTYMDRKGVRQATPRQRDASLGTEPWLDFSSGYVTRSINKFPRQGDKAPWKLHQNYALDIVNLRYSPMDDGVLEFSNPVASASKTATAQPETQPA